MPAITDLPIRTERGYEYFSQGTATTTPTTYTYPGTMTNYIFKNDGSVNVTLTVNGLATTVASGDCAIGTGMASFTVTASSGTISWTMRAFDLIGVPMLQGGVDQTSALKAYTFQTAATGTGNGTVGDVSGYSTLAVRVAITGNASVAFEYSMDNANWAPIAGYTPAGGYALNVSNASADYRYSIAGIKYIRFRISSYSSGTVDITGYASIGQSPIYNGAISNLLGNSDGQTATYYAQSTGSYLLGYNGTTWDRLKTANGVSDAGGLGILTSAPYGFNGTSWDRLRAANGLSDGATTGLPTSAGFLYNPYTGAWDRNRTTYVQNILASAARTTTQNGADLRSYNNKGIIVTLNVTVASGTGGLTIAIQSKDQINNVYKTINATPTAVTATGTYTYLMYPGADATNTGHTQVSNSPLPYLFRVNVSVGDASSYTYSLYTDIIC